MSNRSVKAFSYIEANELVPKIAELTEQVIRELDEVRRRNASEEEAGENPISDGLFKEVEEALHVWSERIIELGGNPKGYFTVDFQSLDPELMYCWNYGEDRIAYIHKVWENFSHRRPLAESVDGGGDYKSWVH
jgi:hypothetical protein